MQLTSTRAEGAVVPPVAWAMRLIERLQALYGAKFSQQWADIKPGRLAELWAEEIAGYTAEEIQRGLAACRARVFPPTLPEFLTLCRPALNPETAYHEAVAGVSARSSGEMGVWSHPAIYWAAQRVSAHDLLSQGWQAIRGRWEFALRDVLAQGRWDPIPAPHLQLAAPGRSEPSREEARRFLASIKATTGSSLFGEKQDPRAWAARVIERAKTQHVSIAVLQMAQRALEAAPDTEATV